MPQPQVQANTAATNTVEVHPWHIATERAKGLVKANLRDSEIIAAGDGCVVTGGQSGMKYRIAQAGHPCRCYIDMLDPQLEEPLLSFCVYSVNGQYQTHPWPDELLALALYVEHDEAKFLHTAVPHCNSQRALEVYQNVRKLVGLWPAG